jgi:hypothetical protein
MKNFLTFSRNQYQNRRKIFFGAIILFVLLSLFIFVNFLINIKKTAQLNILISPVDAKITINQKQYYNGKQKIEPGNYQVKIERDGFQSVNIEINLSSGDQKYLYYCLTPNNQDNTWYKDHPKDNQTCDEINQALNDILKSETMKDPIFSVTPYHNDDKRYYIDSVLNEDRSITIKIKPLSCKAELKKILNQNALNYLKSKNINLDQYKIEYIEDC